MKGVNSKDFEFFKKAKRIQFKHAKLAAFGSKGAPRIKCRMTQL